MRAFHTHALITAGLVLSVLSAQPAVAQTEPPDGLVGAWGQDESCTDNVAIFRADGQVIDTGAAASGQTATYGVSGDTLTLTQAGKTAHFAFAMNGVSVAWSDGADMVLKQRCVDQTPFAAQIGGAGPGASLYDRVLSLAAQPLAVGASTVKVVSVDAHPSTSVGLARGAPYDEIVAHPEPEVVGQNGVLLYRIFPDAAGAAAHASLDIRAPDNFIAETPGPGTMSVASAKDLGPGGAAPAEQQGVINCLRVHPKGHETVVITCLEQLPKSRLLAGGRQTFALPDDAKATDLGPKEDLTETLDLTSMAVDQLRGLLATNPP